ncbi:MAG: ATP-binding protein, partial [Salinivirgaceae bacterium]|nr:ATP-binding protein [Salinivirgaceae bacterium]
MIERILYKNIEDKLFKGKIIVLAGARQVGKTTLLKQILRKKEDVLWLNGDEMQTQNLFNNASADRLLSEFGGSKIVILDEAQRIENIGLRLKLIADADSDIQVIATGSSAFELANKVNEPLAGRKWEYQMFPLSFGEMVSHHGKLKEMRMLPRRIIYGYYPEVVTNEGDEVEILKLLTDAYLYKDILSWENIKHPDKLQTLLRALAYQVGSQVSFNELSQMCSLDSKTVERYITLLEQCYIIFRLPSYSRNLRHELKASRKIYFYVLGEAGGAAEAAREHLAGVVDRECGHLADLWADALDIDPAGFGKGQLVQKIAALREKWLGRDFESAADVREFVADAADAVFRASGKLKDALAETMGIPVKDWRTRAEALRPFFRIVSDGFSEDELKLRALLARLACLAWCKWNAFRDRRGELAFSDMIALASRALRASPGYAARF